MFQKARFLGVAAVILMLGQAAYADFTADITMSGDPPDPSDVAPGTAIVLTIIDTQAYNGSGDGSYFNRIQLNFEDSSTGVQAALEAGTWAWGTAIDTGLTTVIDDSLVGDLIVNRSKVGGGITPASAITVGTLTFNAPMALGTYTLALTGGAFEDTTHTFIRSGALDLDVKEGGVGMTVGS